MDKSRSGSCDGRAWFCGWIAQLADASSQTSPPFQAVKPAARRLRVLQCITRLGLGGSERVALSLVHGFGPEIESGVFAVHGAADEPVGQGMKTELERAGVPWFKGTDLPMKRGGMIPAGFALRRAVRAFRPDLVHFHSETPEACGAAMLALFPSLRAVPAVRTIHNCIFWRYWPRIGRWCDHRLAHAHVAGVSGAALDEFARYRADSGAAAPPSPPRVVHNGIDLPARPPHARPHDPARRRVLFAGRFEWQKGADLIAAILSQVRLPHGVRGELATVGQGTYEPELRALAARPPPGWTVTLRPPVARLSEIFREHDLLLMPSRFEGLGLTSIEASLCGLAVIATDAPGLRDTLAPDHPWLPRPEDPTAIAAALGDALRDSDRWAPTVVAAQRLALTSFTPTAMLAGYREIYARAAARSAH